MAKGRNRKKAPGGGVEGWRGGGTGRGGHKG